MTFVIHILHTHNALRPHDVCMLVVKCFIQYKNQIYFLLKTKHIIYMEI